MIIRVRYIRSVGAESRIMYWSSIGQVLGKYWASIGQVLGKYWASIGQVLGMFCLSTTSLTP